MGKPERGRKKRPLSRQNSITPSQQQQQRSSAGGASTLPVAAKRQRESQEGAEEIDGSLSLRSSSLVEKGVNSAETVAPSATQPEHNDPSLALGDNSAAVDDTSHEVISLPGLHPSTTSSVIKTDPLGDSRLPPHQYSPTATNEQRQQEQQIRYQFNTTNNHNNKNNIAPSNTTSQQRQQQPWGNSNIKQAKGTQPPSPTTTPTTAIEPQQFGTPHRSDSDGSSLPPSFPERPFPPRRQLRPSTTPEECDTLWADLCWFYRLFTSTQQDLFQICASLTCTVFSVQLGAVQQKTYNMSCVNRGGRTPTSTVTTTPSTPPQQQPPESESSSTTPGNISREGSRSKSPAAKLATALHSYRFPSLSILNLSISLLESAISHCDSLVNACFSKLPLPQSFKAPLHKLLYTIPTSRPASNTDKSNSDNTNNNKNNNRMCDSTVPTKSKSKSQFFPLSSTVKRVFYSAIPPQYSPESLLDDGLAWSCVLLDRILALSSSVLQDVGVCTGGDERSTNTASFTSRIISHFQLPTEVKRERSAMRRQSFNRSYPNMDQFDRWILEGRTDMMSSSSSSPPDCPNFDRFPWAVLSPSTGIQSCWSELAYSARFVFGLQSRSGKRTNNGRQSNVSAIKDQTLGQRFRSAISIFTSGSHEGGGSVALRESDGFSNGHDLNKIQRDPQTPHQFQHIRRRTNRTDSSRLADDDESREAMTTVSSIETQLPPSSVASSRHLIETTSTATNYNNPTSAPDSTDMLALGKQTIGHLSDRIIVSNIHDNRINENNMRAGCCSALTTTTTTIGSSGSGNTTAYECEIAAEIGGSSTSELIA